MPKIAATSIEEHVRQQNARITAAAKMLFAEQGFNATDMGQIAVEVGLARNSLYRYFPNKDHILLACIQEDMTPYLQRLALLATEYPDPAERILAWLDGQFEMDATGQRFTDAGVWMGAHLFFHGQYALEEAGCLVDSAECHEDPGAGTAKIQHVPVIIPKGAEGVFQRQGR